MSGAPDGGPGPSRALWLGVWYLCIGAGFVLLSARAWLLGAQAWTVVLRWVIAAGFLALGLLELRARNRPASKP